MMPSVEEFQRLNEDYEKRYGSKYVDLVCECGVKARLTEGNSVTCHCGRSLTAKIGATSKAHTVDCPHCHNKIKVSKV